MAYDPASGYRTELPDEVQLIRAEVADVVDLGPSERARLLASACRSGVQLMRLKSAEDRARVLEYRDPLPPESEAALERMRQQYRARRR